MSEELKEYSAGRMFAEFIMNSVRYNPIDNYILPGLTSYVLGRLGVDGPDHEAPMVRAFVSSRNTPEFVAPHSHVRDLFCHVIAGSVINTNYHEERTARGESWDTYVQTGDFVSGYKHGFAGKRTFVSVSTVYEAGASYYLLADVIHSIRFSRGAVVLIMEGKKKRQSVTVLQPPGVQNFEAADWMFKSNATAKSVDKVLCSKCGKWLTNGIGGCEGAQHGNRGCAINSPGAT